MVWAAGLHDIGLVAIDSTIVRRWLRSPERCKDEEIAMIKRHPSESEQMLKDIPIFAEAATIVRCHHENWDGTGYPDRLKGEAIPWLARLVSASIFFSTRHAGSNQAMTDLEAQKDKMFDPKAVDALAKAVPMTEMPRGEREILISELQAGMVLARDICNTSGMLILAKGKEMNPAWINKILTINSTTPLNPNVLVYC